LFQKFCRFSPKIFRAKILTIFSSKFLYDDFSYSALMDFIAIKHFISVMVSQKIAIRVLLLHYWKKGFKAVTAASEIRSTEGTSAVSARTAQRWFKRFRDGDTSLEDEPRSGRPSVVDEDALRDAVQEDPSLTTRELAADLGSSPATIMRHLHRLGFESKRPRVLPHELTPNQAQRRVNTCRQLLENPLDAQFWRRIITGDEKWIFFRNPNNRNQWLQPGQTGTPVVQTGRFERKIMLCVWWNFKGIVHWELVENGRAVNGELYAEQLGRLHEALSHRYPELSEFF
jgi:histone-lysine N-methyltransferase SETMAR